MKNIILITTDHLRPDTLACHGDPVIQTPNIDALAGQSMDFTHCFAQNPVCQPSRAALMTGRYPRHIGVRHNGSALDENEVTLLELLRSRGYQTAVVGKHHVRQRKFHDSIDHASAGGIRRGWKERADGDYTVHDPNEFESYVRSRGYEYRTGYALPRFRERLGAVPSDLPEDCHLDAYVGMKACEFLRRRQDQRPLFLWVGFYGPHHPYVPSGRFAHMYAADDVPPFHRSPDDLAKKPVEYRLYCQCPDHKYRGFTEASEQTFREMKAAYYGMVSQIDWQVGKLVACLQDASLWEDSIAVFTSDHGEFLGDHGIPAKAPFLLDCQLRVPLMVRAPTAPAASCDELVELVDLFPTVCSSLGLEVPPWVQGRDLTPLVQGDGEYSPREAVYAEMVDKRCLRSRRWKYIHYPGKPYGELYDLEEDPYELNNLYAERPELVEKLRQQFYALMDATEDFVHPTYQRFSGVDPDTGELVTHALTW